MEDPAKKLSEALKKGWKMLDAVCPNCGAPLFQVGREAVCAVCGSRFLLAETEEEAREVAVTASLRELRDSIVFLLDRERGRLEVASPEEAYEIVSEIREMVETLKVIEEVLNIRESRRRRSP